jgi:hypothetical protein
VKYLAFNRELHLATNKGYRSGDGWGSLQDATRFDAPPVDDDLALCWIVPVIDLHKVVERAVYVPAFACADFGDAPLAARIAVTKTLAKRINALFIMMAEHGVDECACNEGVDWVHADDMSLESDAMEVFALGVVFWRAFDSNDNRIETRGVCLDLLFCSQQTVVDGLSEDPWLREALIEREYIAASAP